MISGPLHFREPQPDDADNVRRCTVSLLCSDLAFPNIYLLKNKYGTKLLFHMEHLIRHFSGNGRLKGYTFPVGGNTNTINACLVAIEADAKARQEKLQYCLLTAEQAEYLQQFYGKKAQIGYDRGDADYLYKSSDLALLNGNAYHKKRTHLNKFLKKYPDVVFQKLTPENRQDALNVAQQWLKSQQESPALLHEYRAIENAMFHMEQLHLSGGIVYIDGKPVAMALYSQVNESVTDIHYEKCIPEYRDAYVYINREVAAAVKTEWINREEDLNVDGLRKAKLSYHPALILSKYTATIYVD